MSLFGFGIVPTRTPPTDGEFLAAVVAIVVVLILAIAMHGCIDITGTSTSYFCIVDSDTLHVRGDTSGVRCAPFPDSLPEF